MQGFVCSKDLKILIENSELPPQFGVTRLYGTGTYYYVLKIFFFK